MAYIDMAYVVMAERHLAGLVVVEDVKVVMAYIVMACIVMACHLAGLVVVEDVEVDAVPPRWLVRQPRRQPFLVTTVNKLCS